jgi:hypothetical protein
MCKHIICLHIYFEVAVEVLFWARVFRNTIKADPQSFVVTRNIQGYLKAKI